MPQINCLDSHIVEILKKPMRVLSVSFPVKMDDGTIRVFEGYRSQHNDAIGPTNVKLSEVMVNSFHAVNQAAKKYETDLRTAANMISLQRIVEAMKARGWV